MTYSLLPTTPADAEAMASLLYLTSLSEPRVKLVFKDCPVEEWKNWYIQAVKRQWENLEKRGEEWKGKGELVKVVDEGGLIVGFGCWAWEGDAESILYEGISSIPLPTGTNISARKKINELDGELEDEHQPKESHYVLINLLTHPSHYRKGIASLIMKYGTEIADRENKICFCGSTGRGVPLYLKCGFEEVGRVEMDLGEMGGEGVHKHVAMIRKPRQKA